MPPPENDLIEQTERVCDAFLMTRNRTSDEELKRWVLGWSPEAIQAASMAICQGDEQEAAIFIAGIATGLRMAEQED